MSVIRSVFVAAVLATTSLAASAQAAAPGGHRPPPHVAPPAETSKHAACERVWTAQRIRHGTRQAFVAACVAKG